MSLILLNIYPKYISVFKLKYSMLNGCIVGNDDDISVSLSRKIQDPAYDKREMNLTDL